MKIFREMLFLEGYSSQPHELVDARDCNDFEEETEYTALPSRSTAACATECSAS